MHKLNTVITLDDGKKDTMMFVRGYWLQNRGHILKIYEYLANE